MRKGLLREYLKAMLNCSHVQVHGYIMDIENLTTTLFSLYDYVVKCSQTHLSLCIVCTSILLSHCWACSIDLFINTTTKICINRWRDQRFFKEANFQVITTHRNYKPKYYKSQRTVDGCVYFCEIVNRTCVLKLASFIAQLYAGVVFIL